MRGGRSHVHGVHECFLGECANRNEVIGHTRDFVSDAKDG